MHVCVCWYTEKSNRRLNYRLPIFCISNIKRKEKRTVYTFVELRSSPTASIRHDESNSRSCVMYLQLAYHKARDGERRDGSDIFIAFSRGMDKREFHFVKGEFIKQSVCEREKEREKKERDRFMIFCRTTCLSICSCQKSNARIRWHGESIITCLRRNHVDTRANNRENIFMSPRVIVMSGAILHSR